MGPGFCATVATILDTTGMDPAALALEVTEGIFIDDGDRAVTVLADIKKLGVHLALDDFGTGYCSLAYLRRFLVDMVKIDQRFIANFKRNTAAATVAAAVTNLAHDLGMSVTAEGVETEQQQDEVLSIGCELAQGFLYARPMTGPDLSARLKAIAGHPLHLPHDTRRATADSRPN